MLHSTPDLFSPEAWAELKLDEPAVLKRTGVAYQNARFRSSPCIGGIPLYTLRRCAPIASACLIPMPITGHDDWGDVKPWRNRDASYPRINVLLWGQNALLGVCELTKAVWRSYTRGGSRLMTRIVAMT